MKRTLLTILAVIAMLPVMAQRDTTQRRIDTVRFPLNMPTYYENAWMNGRESVTFSIIHEWQTTTSQLDLRRYDIPGDSLRIIGLAGVFGIADPSLGTIPYADTVTMEGRLPEYLQLYECTPDTVTLIKQMSWRYGDERCRISLIADGHRQRYPGLYEVYFDEPITVRDSFYVGGTEENDDWIDPNVGKLHWETVKYDALPKDRTDSITMRGRIPHMYNDPNWDTSRWFIGKTLSEWMLFPIIDTTGMTPPDTTQGGDTTVVDTTVLDTTGISRLADQFTRILPNPTTGHAVVHSSIPMRSVAVYDPAGRCILRRRVDGTIAQLDLEGHARGQYYVVIETPAGRALKRLLLQ